MRHLVVRAIEPAEYGPAAGVAARALRDSPTTVATYGDDPMERLARTYPLFVNLLEDSRAPQLGAFCDSCPVGLVVASPPGRCVGSLFGPYVEATLSRPEPSLGDPAREQVFWARSAERDLQEEHWHLGPVGVEPNFQGQGIGGEVMRELCATFDRDGCIGWLETDKEINVRFYSAHGFEVVDRTSVLGVPTWFMRRDPQRAR